MLSVEQITWIIQHELIHTGRCTSNFESAIVNSLQKIVAWALAAEQIALRWMPQNLTNVKSTSIQVMA